MLSASGMNGSNIKRSATVAGLGDVAFFAIGTLPTRQRTAVETPPLLSPSEMARTDEWNNNSMVSFSNSHPPTVSNHTMSDLDSVIGGFLSIANLYEENDSMRRQLREIRAVEITGKNGSPVYARAQLDDHGKFLDFIGYKVTFRPASPLDQQQQPPPPPEEDVDPLAPCFLRDLNNLEVHVGALRFEMGRNNDRFMISKISFCPSSRHGHCIFSPNHHQLPVEAVLHLSFQIGPFPSPSAFHGFDPNATTLVGAPSVSFYNVVFCADDIKSLIHNFELRRPAA